MESPHDDIKYESLDNASILDVFYSQNPILLRTYHAYFIINAAVFWIIYYLHTKQSNTNRTTSATKTLLSDLDTIIKQPHKSSFSGLSVEQLCLQCLLFLNICNTLQAIDPLTDAFSNHTHGTTLGLIPYAIQGTLLVSIHMITIWFIYKLFIRLDNYFKQVIDGPMCLTCPYFVTVVKIELLVLGIGGFLSWLCVLAFNDTYYLLIRNISYIIVCSDLIRKNKKLHHRFKQLDGNNQCCNGGTCGINNNGVDSSVLDKLKSYIGVDGEDIFGVIKMNIIFLASTVIITSYEAIRLYGRPRDTRYLILEEYLDDSGNGLWSIWTATHKVDYVALGFIFEFWVVTAFPALISGFGAYARGTARKDKEHLDGNKMGLFNFV